MKQIIMKILPDKVVQIIRKFKKAEKTMTYRLSTSLSDNEVYPDFCLKASIDNDLFTNFRRNHIYCQILEHVSRDLGMLYLKEIERINDKLLNDINLFKKNDEWGNPEAYKFPIVGEISPSTLR